MTNNDKILEILAKIDRSNYNVKSMIEQIRELVILLAKQTTENHRGPEEN